MEYKEFKLSDIFVKMKTNRLPYKAGELPKTPNKNFNLPALTAGVLNQGLSCYVPREGATILKDCISVSANGANTGAMFYQENEFTVLQDAYALECRKPITKYAYFYLISAMQKVIKGNFDWSNKAGWERIKDLKILLPVASSGEPDYAYMKQYMKDIEAQTINELKAKSVNISEDLKKETGISSIELTEEENELLNRKVEYGEFKVGELFEIYHGSRIKNSDRIDGDIPFITAGKENRGYVGCIGNDCAIYNRPITIDMFGNCFYQNMECSGDDNIYFFVNNLISDNAKVFISAIISKLINGFYSYSKQFRQKDADNLIIALPITSLGQPDYAYMEQYMKLQEKLLLQESNGFVVDLEEIIENQMKNIYKKVYHCTVETYDNMNKQTSKGKYTMLIGSDLIGYYDSNKSIADVTERMRDAVVNKHIGVTKSANIIHLYMDENWSIEEIQNFINKTINRKEIVDAINSGELKLKIDGLKQENYFDCQKEIPYYDWRSLHRNGWNIFAVIDSLKAVGIEVKLGDK